MYMILKVSSLEGQVFEAQGMKDKYQTNQADFDRLVREHKDLADEYVTLKNNYLVVAKENEMLVFFILLKFSIDITSFPLRCTKKMLPNPNYRSIYVSFALKLSKNEELSTELLNLVNAKATLIRQLENYRLSGLDIPAIGNESPEQELERIKAIGMPCFKNYTSFFPLGKYVVSNRSSAPSPYKHITFAPLNILS